MQKSNMNGWHSDNLNHHDDIVMIFKKILKFYIKDYIKIAKYGMKYFEINNIWININTKNQ